MPDMETDVIPPKPTRSPSSVNTTPTTPRRNTENGDTKVSLKAAVNTDSSMLSTVGTPNRDASLSKNDSVDGYATPRADGAVPRRQPRRAAIRPTRRFDYSAGGPKRDTNDERCGTCDRVGQFICCDGCPLTFHFNCVDPPLDPNNLPEGEWLCTQCRAKKRPPLSSGKDVWDRALYQLQGRNASIFSLPKNLIRSVFPYATLNEDGEFEDTFDRKRPHALPDSIVNDESGVLPDLRLLDDHNHTVRICFRCGLSATHGRRMLTCGYCPLHWHMDCIPITHPPGPSRRWRCPAHVSKPDFLTTKRPQIAYLDVDDPRMAPFDGDYDVLNDVQPSFYDLRLGGVRYRVPESAIRVDFCQAAKRQRLAHRMEEDVVQFLAECQFNHQTTTAQDSQM